MGIKKNSNTPQKPQLQTSTIFYIHGSNCNKEKCKNSIVNTYINKEKFHLEK